MNFRSPIVFVIIIVAVVIVAGWAYFENRSAEKKRQEAAIVAETPKPVSNLANLDPTDFDAVVKKEVAVATEKAVAVNPEFKISAIEVEIGQDLLPESTNTRYVFSAPTEKDNNWMITVAQVSRNYIRALIPKSDYLGEVEPINAGLWKYNYVTALQLAEKAGGLDWREKNELQSLKMTLRHAGAKKWLLWIVEYKGTSGDLVIQLDANSGNVVTE